jgi:hypothetical protein
MGHGGPVHIDVVVVAKVQKPFSGELSVVVGNYRISIPKQKMIS